MNLLIIEDDIILARNLKKSFQRNSFAHIVQILYSLEDFLHHSHVEYYDIILLDICLWESNTHGIEILRHIRKNNKNIPIIMISSFSEYDLLQQAFNLWAHDYIIKPFRNLELQIRIQRWFKNYIYFNYYSSKETIQYHDLYYNLNTNEFFIWENKIYLSKLSKYTLLVLLTHKEQLVSKEYLCGKLWWNTSHDNNLRVIILRLKKYLEKFGIHHWISTVQWEGYMLIHK